MIDDDELTARSTSEYFNILGCKTAYVTSYDAAVAFLDTHEGTSKNLPFCFSVKSKRAMCGASPHTPTSKNIVFRGSHEISLLLLDINLGGRSGFDLCKKIRESYDMPILFISARTSDDDVIIARNIGGDDYINPLH